MQLNSELLKIKSIATQVRKKILRFVNNKDKTLKNYCGVSSVCLFNHLKKEGIKANIVCGYVKLNSKTKLDHIWIEYKEFIIDITFKQFDKRSKSVLITSLSDERFVDRHMITRNVNDFNKFVSCCEEHHPINGLYI